MLRYITKRQNSLSFACIETWTIVEKGEGAGMKCAMVLWQVLCWEPSVSGLFLTADNG
jgi:hypothetical protein